VLSPFGGGWKAVLAELAAAAAAAVAAALPRGERQTIDRQKRGTLSVVFIKVALLYRNKTMHKDTFI